MRKIITSTVLILLFSLFSGSVFAGKYDDCDVFKGAKRLYGLCNAYQNAFNHKDEAAMADIWANWSKWATDDDPALPNSPGDVVQTVFETSCLCWPGLSVQEICDMGTPDLVPYETGGGFLFLENFFIDPPEINEFQASNSMCRHTRLVFGSAPKSRIISGFDFDFAATCMAEVEEMADPAFCP